jgi:hypothetical protein
VLRHCTEGSHKSVLGRAADQATENIWKCLAFRRDDCSSSHSMVPYWIGFVSLVRCTINRLAKAQLTSLNKAHRVIVGARQRCLGTRGFREVAPSAWASVSPVRLESQKVQALLGQFRFHTGPSLQRDGLQQTTLYSIKRNLYDIIIVCASTLEFVCGF